MKIWNIIWFKFFLMLFFGFVSIPVIDEFSEIIDYHNYQKDVREWTNIIADPMQFSNKIFNWELNSRFIGGESNFMIREIGTNYEYHPVILFYIDKTIFVQRKHNVTNNEDFYAIMRFITIDGGIPEFKLLIVNTPTDKNIRRFCSFILGVVVYLLVQSVISKIHISRRI